MKAAYALSCEQGYAATTMVQVAEAAGVAVQTVYFMFHTKPALLSRAYEVQWGTGAAYPRAATLVHGDADRA